ncbi:MAG: zf-HC2 domain-containing protein [Acidobacteriota bacterium]
MSCDEIQKSLSLYVDDGVTAEVRKLSYQHLEVCPVCRAHVAELREIRHGLAMLSRPSPPADLVPSINKALAVAASAQRARRNLTFGDLVTTCLQPRLMRYAFSSFASLILFSAVFLALRPHMLALHDAAIAFDVASASSPSYVMVYDINQPITPQNYAALRAPFNTESPSLNPGGALATLTWGPEHLRRDGRQSDDDMVVVADVFSNGKASLADVMQAPRDRRMLADFEKALRENAAFVPAALDRRPETMRVVFSVQRVDVHARNY